MPVVATTLATSAWINNKFLHSFIVDSYYGKVEYFTIHFFFVLMAVVGGREHTLTLDDNGDVWAFGYNINGQCGHDTNGENVKIPTRLYGLPDIVQIAADNQHSACVDVEGCVWTFGNNDKGQLGHGDTKKRCSPTKVDGLENIVSISCGYRHTICLSSNHKVYAFGHNEHGLLGIGTNVNYELSPVLVPLDVDIKQIQCGGFHSIFLTCDGDVWVCGGNEWGQLGLGDVQDRNTPVKNTYFNDIVSVQCGDFHTIVMNEEHQVFSLGENDNGQLCLKDDVKRTNPEQIQFTKEIQSFSCGDYHTLILDTSNRVWVFGMEDIEGNRFDEYYEGVMLNEPSDVCLMSNGGNNVFLKCTSNEIWAFGFNNYNQIPLSIPDRYPKMKKSERIPPEYFKIFGTPINRFKIRAKSARSNLT